MTARRWPRCAHCGRACYTRKARFCSDDCRRAAGALGRRTIWPWRDIPIGGGFSIPKRRAGSYMDTSNNALRHLAQGHWERAQVIKCRQGVTVIRLAAERSTHEGGGHAAHQNNQA